MPDRPTLNLPVNVLIAEVKGDTIAVISGGAKVSSTGQTGRDFSWFHKFRTWAMKGTLP
jgi:hypothetical protein